MTIMNLIEIRARHIKKQTQNLKEFATEPKGIFETVDESVKTFRRANQQTLNQLMGQLR